MAVLYVPGLQAGSFWVVVCLFKGKVAAIGRVYSTAGSFLFFGFHLLYEGNSDFSCDSWLLITAPRSPTKSKRADISREGLLSAVWLLAFEVAASLPFSSF